MRTPNKGATLPGVALNELLEQENMIVENHLRMIYLLERTKQHRAASKIVFRFIETNFADSNLASVNLLLKTADFEKLSKWSISGLVRFTTSAKTHLPAWPSAYRKAKLVLLKRGENVEAIFAGIKE